MTSGQDASAGIADNELLQAQLRCRGEAFAEHCQLCGDDAEVGSVLEVNVAERTATVALSSGSATVALDLIDATVGDRVLVHMGFAIERVPSA